MKIKQMLGLLSAVLLIGTTPAAWAGEGHSHEEGPVAETGKALPSVTAVSKEYELVGRLKHDELSILIDRASSTEPVLASSLQVEGDGRRAKAPFDAGHGDYSVTDPEFLAWLHKPGHKTLTFTLTHAGGDEVMNGELDVHDEDLAEAGSPRSWKNYAAWVIGLIGGVILLIFAQRRLKAFRQQRLGGAA
jgi:hypothetical protein